VRRSKLLSLALAGTLLWPILAGAQTDIIGQTRAAVAAGDFRRAEAIAREGLVVSPGAPRALEALSWVARGALAAGDLNLALTVARDTRRFTEEALGGRSPDVDQYLEIALGAAIEVQALVVAGRGERTDAVYLLERALEQYAGTVVHARLQKNSHLLSLVGAEAVALDTSEFLGEARASLDDLHGKPLVIFFWAHWCSDCKAQAPSIAALMDEFGVRGLQVIAPTQRYGYTQTPGVAAGREEERAHIAVVQRESYPFLSDVPMPLSEANFLNYGVSSTPTLALIDRDGIVRLYNPGNLDEATLRDEVRALVE
jgi:thiol-disulfide isomerase/thioredoxin